VNGLWGYIKENGEFLIEPMYKSAKDSLENVLHVVDDNGIHFLRCAMNGEFIGGDTGFDLAELLGERDDAYVVRNGHKYGILACDGVWLADMRYEWIVRLSDDLVWLQDDGVVRDLITRKNVAKATALDRSSLEEFGVFSCYNKDLDQTEFFKLDGNRVESLMIESGHQALEMKTPDIIFGPLIRRWGPAKLDHIFTVSCGMFSISKKKWIFRDLRDVEYCEEDGFAYYLVKKGVWQGVVDVDGNVMIDPVARKLEYWRDNFLVNVEEKCTLYNISERKLELPFADAMVEWSDNEVDVVIFIKKEKRRFGTKNYYRYWVNGKFVTNYEYTGKQPQPFEKHGDAWFARVQCVDGRKGWIDVKGKFLESLPGSVGSTK